MAVEARFSTHARVNGAAEDKEKHNTMIDKVPTLESVLSVQRKHRWFV